MTTIAAESLVPKRLPIAKWITKDVNFPVPNVDVVVPHTLEPKTPGRVKFETVDRNSPGSVYRGLKSPQSNYIVLRASIAGTYRVRLYIEANGEDKPTELPPTTFEDTIAYLDQDNAFTGNNTFAGSSTFNGGITFPATQVPSSNINTLDDYEEGTFTPVLEGSGGTSGQTYTTQLGWYVKIGQQVNATFYVHLSAKGTITGDVIISGLPFVASGLTGYFGGAAISYWGNFNTALVALVGLIPISASYVLLRGAAAATASVTTLATASITDTTQVVGFVSYRASA